MTLLGVTRSAEELGDLSTNAERVGVELVALPFVIHKDVELTARTMKILKESDWLLFTSSRGVDSLVRSLKRAGVSALPQAKAAVVGEMTSATAESAGLNVSFVPEKSNAQGLFTEFSKNYKNQAIRVTYVSAQETHFDPAEIMSRSGMEYQRIVSYRSEAQRVQNSSVARFSASDSILFTSPLTVRAYFKQFGKPTARTLAIGLSTAAEMTRAGWKAVVTLPEPKVELALRSALSDNNRILTNAN